MDIIRWNEPVFREEELKEVSEVIKNNYVNEGPKTKELEEELKNYLGVKYVILTTNATAALFLSIKSEAIKRGVKDFEVIIPDLTMFATATAVDWAGGKPILVDIIKDDLTIDASKIEEKINSKTIAIVPVHILGRSANMEKIMLIAKEKNIAIIEDAAGSLGSKNKNKFQGTIGDIGCFSLQSNKIITSGQGGIIALDNNENYEIIRRLRDFGRLNNKEFLHEKIGYNLKFNDLSAALGIAQFKKINSRINLLKEQFKIYNKELSNVKEIKFFKYKDGEVPLWIDVFAEDKLNLKSFLEINNIFCRECWPSIHRNAPYLVEDKNFPNSSFASDNILWLPNGPALNEEKIKFVCEKIKAFYEK